MFRDHLRPLMQASRKTGSVGQGALRFKKRIIPLAVKRPPAQMKTQTLFSDIQMRPGTFALRPAITAPIPKLTSNAGSAQQSSVDSDVKRVKNESTFFDSILTFLYFQHYIRNQLKS